MAFPTVTSRTIPAKHFCNDITMLSAFNYAMPNYRQTNRSRFSEQTLQVDYTQPLNKAFNIEAGIKGIVRNNKSDFRHLAKDSSSGTFMEIPAFTIRLITRVSAVFSWPQAKAWAKEGRRPILLRPQNNCLLAANN